MRIETAALGTAVSCGLVIGAGVLGACRGVCQALWTVSVSGSPEWAAMIGEESTGAGAETAESPP